MTVEHSHSAGQANHGADCGCDRSRWRSVLTIPLAPLRWAVVGCLGLAVFGMVLPFTPIPPCPMLTLTGVPCPLCGMTRSVRALLRLDPAGSLRFQPFGALAGLAAIAVLATWALPRTRAVTAIRIPVVVLIAAVAASWIWNIGFNPTFS